MQVLVSLVLSGLALLPQERDPEARRQMAQKMMEASFHLNSVFDKDIEARVPVEELDLPQRARARFDENGDGFVTFAEYEAMAKRSPARPVPPRDRSDFTHLNDEGFPLNVDPKIVSADDVELGDDDLVMGVVIGDEPRAYPVNYMNGPYNEVVNDELGGRAIAPSW